MESDLRGIILDIDGTLVDSNRAHAEAWRLAFSEFGIVANVDDIRGVTGLGAENVLPRSAGIQVYSPVGRAISRRRREIFTTRFLPNLKPFPKAKDLIRRFHDSGVRVVAASANEPSEAAELIGIVDAEPYIDVVVTAFDEPPASRDHDLVRAALRKAELPADVSLMVGDTPYDYEAARKARVPFIGLLCGGWTSRDFPDAVGIFNSPADMLQRFAFPEAGHVYCGHR